MIKYKAPCYSGYILGIFHRQAKSCRVSNSENCQQFRHTHAHLHTCRLKGHGFCVSLQKLTHFHHQLWFVGIILSDRNLEFAYGESCQGFMSSARGLGCADPSGLFKPMASVSWELPSISTEALTSKCLTNFIPYCLSGEAVGKSELTCFMPHGS